MDRILNKISEYILTKEGEVLLEKRKPSDDIEEIKRRYNEYKRFEFIFRKKALSIPVYSPPDAISLNRFFVYLKNYLEEFLEFYDSLEEFKEIREEYLGSVSWVRDFKKLLDKTFDDEGKIKDTASYNLKYIREKKRETYREIEKTIKGSIERYRKMDILRGEEIYYREGRFVLCLKTLPSDGVLVSYSRTGESFFVEPYSVISLTNKFKRLEEEEIEEEKRILRDISKRFDSIKEDFEFIKRGIGIFDMYNAIYNFANSIDAEVPEFGYEKKLRLKRAYHPLLKLSLNNKCVPYNVEVKEGFFLFLITGPNGGGKTTFLSAVYLLTEMVMRSIPVSADSDSYFYIPKKIYRAGFEERDKLEEGLSSFTFYLDIIKKSFVENEERKFVLLDEFMGNTDPEEGGSLGVGILKEYIERGIFTITATHNEKIKSLLKDQEGVLMGGFSMDVDSMKPTYVLEVGKVSPSYALYVARKVGLPSSVFDKIPDSAKVFDTIYTMKKEIEKEKEFILKEKMRLEERKDKIEREYREELKKKIKRFEKELENLKKEFKTYKKEESLRKMERKIKEVRMEEEKVKIPKELVKGRYYGILGSGVKGKLIEKKGNKAILEVEGKKMELSIMYLREIEEKDEEKVDIRSYTLPLPSRVISIRGMSAEEAEEIIIRFLYDARAAGYKEVRVVHGEGKGILKNIVKKVTNNIGFVKKIFHPPWNEGGDGVTVIQLE